MHNQVPQSYEKGKHRSEIFVDMQNYIKEIMATKPEIIEKAIKDRNIIIKALKADIDHRKIAFKEIENRNDSQLNTIQKYIIDNKKLKDDNDVLTQTNKTLTEEINKLKIIVEAEKQERESKLYYKLNKLANNIPGRLSRLFFKFLFSPELLKYVILAVFCILFIASITGWGFVLNLIKPIIIILFS